MSIIGKAHAKVVWLYPDGSASVVVPEATAQETKSSPQERTQQRWLKRPETKEVVLQRWQELVATGLGTEKLLAVARCCNMLQSCCNWWEEMNQPVSSGQFPSLEKQDDTSMAPVRSKGRGTHRSVLRTQSEWTQRGRPRSCGRKRTQGDSDFGAFLD